MTITESGKCVNLIVPLIVFDGDVVRCRDLARKSNKISVAIPVGKVYRIEFIRIHCAINIPITLTNRGMEQRGRDNLKEITVRVQDNDLEKAMRILKKKIQNDGLFKRLKLKKSYEKPSEYRRRKQREALRRQRIAAARRKRYR